MTGILGRFELTANTAKTIVSAAGTTVCKVNITNPTANNVTASIAITDDVDAINDPAHYIEFNTPIKYYDALVRDGIIISPGQHITVISNTSAVVAVATGVAVTA